MTRTHWDGYWEHPGVPGRPLALRGDEEPLRPSQTEHVPFDVCLAYEYDSGLAPFTGAIVPIEHVRPGDRQVVVQGRLGTPGPDEPVAVDDLARIGSLESIIADRPIRLSRPLPQVRELIVTSGVHGPDEATLRNLPNLQRLCMGRSASGPTIDLGVLVGMPHLEDLRFRANQVSTIEPIGNLTGLRRLRIEDHTFESIAPLASVTGLRWLAIGWWKGMDRLGPLTEVEDAEFNEGTVSSLRPFGGWQRLRSLTIIGRKLKSLAGIERLSGLEDLYLYNPGVTDLTPLEAVTGLRRLRLDMPTKVGDFAPIGRLERLESLIIDFKGSDAAVLPRLSDLAQLRGLRELALIGADGSGWRFLLDLPDLRRIRLFGSVDPDAPELLRRRFPDALVDVRPVEAKAVTPIEVNRLADGQWSIFADVHDVLGVSDNFKAEARLRKQLASADPELLSRLEFDSEADALGVVGGSEADLRRVLAVLTGG